jgi:hypothetical protein
VEFLPLPLVCLNDSLRIDYNILLYDANNCTTAADNVFNDQFVTPGFDTGGVS